MECQLCQEGLFLPLDDHIEVYCKTPHYTQCKHCILHSEKHSLLMDKQRQAPWNRRRYERIETCNKVTLVELLSSGQPLTHSSIIGQTVDLSKGGMHFTTEKPMVKGTIVQFSFDRNFPENLQEGKGQIAWCNKHIDEPGYHAGISFQKDHLLNAMEYLGLI